MWKTSSRWSSSVSGSAWSCRCSCSPRRTPSTTESSASPPRAPPCSAGSAARSASRHSARSSRTDLASELASRFPAGVQIPAAANPEIVKHLPAGVRAPYIDAFAAALQPVFLTRDRHLHRLPAHLAAPRTAAAPGGAGGEEWARRSRPLTKRELRARAGANREVAIVGVGGERARIYDRLIARSGLALTPAEARLLQRIAERSPTSEPALADGAARTAAAAARPAGRRSTERGIHPRRFRSSDSS